MSIRPGPVLIDIPVDISRSMIPYRYPERLHLPGYRPTYRGHPRQIKAAADLLRKAKRPVLYVGGGAIRSGPHKEIYRLATNLNIPVTTTLMGLGSFPETHKLSLGMLGMHGTWYANTAISKADLIIALGVRFDDRVIGALGTFAPSASIVHIDIDPAEIGKNISPLVPIVGNVKDVAAAFIHGFRLSVGPRGEGSEAGHHGLRHCGRRKLSDDGPGARCGRHRKNPGEGGDIEQWIFRDGEAVAAAFL